MVQPHAIGRLSLYRRLLTDHLNPGTQFVFSHELATMARVSPAQVRRDLMHLDSTGSPSKGYRVDELVASLGNELDHPTGQLVALVGIGNLGRALMTYFQGRRERLAITAAFDRDPEKVNRVYQGCRCHHVEELETVLKRDNIRTTILAVPAADAQRMADRLVAAGVRGLLNYAPVPLRVPNDVYVEEQDMTTALERVAYFARERRPPRRED
ncbi:MAG: redox-sensing transcriptional repressor Rex [Polyangiaceae bacterium]|nr:redox-sensing transcriptional repressor Rex [Polyangiaceae bacterium]